MKLTEVEFELILESLELHIHVILGHIRKVFDDVILYNRKNFKTKSKHSIIDRMRHHVKMLDDYFKILINDGMTYNVYSDNINSKAVALLKLIRKLKDTSDGSMDGVELEIYRNSSGVNYIGKTFSFSSDDVESIFIEISKMHVELDHSENPNLDVLRDCYIKIDDIVSKAVF